MVLPHKIKFNQNVNKINNDERTTQNHDKIILYQAFTLEYTKYYVYFNVIIIIIIIAIAIAIATATAITVLVVVIVIIIIILLIIII